MRLDETLKGSKSYQRDFTHRIGLDPLAIREENEMLELFGDKYKGYMKVTPRYFPFITGLKAIFRPTFRTLGQIFL